MPISELARRLGVSRTAAQARLDKLVRNGVIAGFTVRLSPRDAQGLLRALLMLKVAAGSRASVEQSLYRIPGLGTMLALSGTYSLAAVVSVPDTGELDSVVESIGALPGVTDVLCSVILSTRSEDPQAAADAARA